MFPPDNQQGGVLCCHLRSPSRANSWFLYLLRMSIPNRPRTTKISYHRQKHPRPSGSSCSGLCPRRKQPNRCTVLQNSLTFHPGNRKRQTDHRVNKRERYLGPLVLPEATPGPRLGQPRTNQRGIRVGIVVLFGLHKQSSKNRVPNRMKSRDDLPG